MAAEEQFADKTHAKIYSNFRKDTPPFLIEKVIDHLKEHYDGALDFALDVGCGAGQSTVALAPFFKRVHGMDVSKAQIEEAEQSRKLPNVTYEVSGVEVLPFEDGSIQLITAAAALHWFQLDKFFPEARRVLCRNGILAVYCYYSIKPLLNDPQASKDIDDLYEEFYSQTSTFHAPQAKIAYSRYKDIEFPFEEVQRFDDISDVFEARIEDMVGYINTFSGFQNWLKVDNQKATEFVKNFEERIKQTVSKCGIDINQSLQAYRSFVLIICRKG